MKPKKWAVTVAWIVCASMFAFFCVTAQAQSKNTPKLVLKETTHDFGQVKQGEVLEHSFVIHNEGTAPLQIKNVRPG